MSYYVFTISLHSLNVCKATGLHGRSARFLKDGANQISSVMAHIIINLSLYSGRIPNDMKTARVVLLYKTNSKSEPGNYRPVPILTFMSKILEKTVHKHLRSENFLYDYQSGFRNSNSTDSCLTHLTDQIRFELDKGNYTGMVMIDLQKAFDTFDHDILLNKLKAIGLDDLSISWYSSYLKNRFQKTEIDGIFSDPMVVPCRVPQGSILGPLLFLIYVNDMEAAVSCRLIFYADYPALLVSGTSVSVIEETLGHELTEWLVDNKLYIHLGKTESILFGSNKKNT